MTKEEAKDIYIQKREELDIAREQYNNILVENLRKKYIGQFVKFTELPSADINEEPIYMFIENIWGDPDSKVYVEGPSFDWYISKYADTTSFNWCQWHQYTFYYSSFNSDGDFENLYVISKEEYKSEFKRGIKKMEKEEENFNYK